METEQEEVLEGLPDDMICSICYAEFVDSEDLQMHVRQMHLTDASKRRFCKICAKIFADMETYALHIRNEHLCQLKCCKYCIRLFSETHDLLKHQKRHKFSVLRPRISCAYCKNVYINKRELEKHDFKEHSDINDGLILKDCLSVLSTLLNMNARRFLEASYGKFQYTCIVCDMNTLDISTFINHLIDKKCRSLSCEFCSNVFTSKRNLYIHIMRHVFPQYNYKPTISKKQCNKCQQMFKSNSLKFHIRKCAGLKCVPCDIVFDCVNKYTDHMSGHTKQTIPLEVCIYCQRQMVGVEAMRKHVSRTHKHEIHLYKYHCTDCDRLFKHPKLLFAHFFSKHRDLYPYTCKICDKKFRIRKNFSLHIKLDHKSIGFVEFDDNFHVSFTDKKSNKQSSCQAVIEDAVDDKNDKNERNIEDEVALTLTGEDSNSSNKATDKSDTETIQTDKNNDKAILSDDPLREDMCKTNADSKLAASEDKHFNGKKFETADRNDKIEIEIDIATNSQMKTTNLRRSKRNIDIPSKQPRKKVRTQPKITQANDANSEDSDTPLLTIHKRLEIKQKYKKVRRDKHGKICKTNFKRLRNAKTQSNKFVCTKCNRNCYTFQNFKRHQALHVKNETKICIKCDGKFDSVKALNEHIKAEHSSSKLTETLKKMIEKRKITEANKQNSKIVSPDASNEIIVEPKTLTVSEKFCNTIKKVPIDKCYTKATISIVDSSKISVKKYLESFVPENNEVKLSIVPQECPFEAIGVTRRPLIRLTKFTPETKNVEPVKLRMPVKFTDNTNDDCEVSIQLVQNIAPPTMNFVNETEATKYDDEVSYDDTYDTGDHYDTETQNKPEIIPEVAQEVLLFGTEEEPCKVLHTMSLKNIRPGDDIAIAHLLPHAPYYKISKLKSVLGKDGQTFIPKDDKVKKDEIEVPKDITLPNGTKLVSVNPLAHLMDKDTICEVLKARKPKYLYYRPKLRNITEAITKAMVKLENVPTVKKKS